MDSTISDDYPAEAPTWKFWKKRRYILVSMFFLGFVNVYTLRVNLSVAIVAMTNGKNVTTPEGEIIEEPPYVDYTRQEQGVILSAFFYGYICTQILGGVLTRYIKATYVFGFAIASTSVLTLITPLVASNFAALISVRVVEGFFEGVSLPCLHAMLSKWAPPLERTRMSSIVFAGNYFGTVVGMPLSGVIGDELGWEWIFYIFGIIGCIWCAAWFAFIRSTPDTDPWISEQERDYIKKSIGASVALKPAKTPWRQIWTSTATWANTVAHFSENWGYYTLLTQLPTFMNDIIDFDLKSAGFVSSLPYLVMGLLMPFTGYTADLLIKGDILSIRNVRRFYNCGGFIAQCVFMMLAAYILNKTAIITCLTFGVGLGAFAMAGFSVNHLDIAPQHAAVLIGISNTFATIPGIISPSLTGLLVTSDDQEEMKTQWRTVFFISASIYLFGAVFYWFFVSGKLQPWAVEEEKLDLESKRENKHAYDNKALNEKDTKEL